MINCSDTTNIFALGFGLSAVIAVVGESAASARRRFLAAVAAEIKLTSPELHEKNLSNERFERYVFASFPGIRKIIYLNLPIRLFAAFVLVASLGTLVQVAVLGTSCTMSEQNLYTYIVLAFV